MIKSNNINKKNKVTILTLGCCKNLVDSERLGGIVAANGMELTENINKAS